VAIADPARLADAPETLDDPADFPDPDRLYEVVDGRFVEKKLGAFENWVTFRLGYLIEAFVEANGLGRTFVETFFRTRRTPTSNRMRKPDVSFLSSGRWPLDRPVPPPAPGRPPPPATGGGGGGGPPPRPVPKTTSFEVAPDLVVEVISPTDRAVAVHAKVFEYFEAGVARVWQVYHATGSIVVHESPAASRTYRRGEVLDGGPVLPGFRLALADLLPEPGPSARADDEPLGDDD